jgi:hypothetical protein
MKNDGTLKLCIDFRKLNDLTLKDSFPLPRIDETLNKLNVAKFFPVLIYNLVTNKFNWMRPEKKKNCFHSRR